MILRFSSASALITDFRKYARCLKCFAPSFVPAVAGIDDVDLFVNFGNSMPSDYQLYMVDTCDRDSQLVTVGCRLIAFNGEYWYGIFKNLSVTTQYENFVFALQVSGGVYFSDPAAIDLCSDLMKLSVCYPADYNAEDINGAYIGEPDYDYVMVGYDDVRYSHVAWVRGGEVMEKSNKISYVASRKRSFASTLIRQWELSSELVPGWYKDVLLSIFFRGNILVDGVEGHIVDLPFEDVDVDRWKTTAVLEKTDKGAFGCAPITCLPQCVCYPVDYIEPVFKNPVVGKPYLYSILIKGTKPFILSDIDAPDWLEVSTDNIYVYVSGTPASEDLGSFHLYFKLENDCGEKETDVTLIVEPCQPVVIPAFILPNATVGVIYKVNIPFTGNSPILITDINIPSWATLTLVDGFVILTGLPTVLETGDIVEFTLSNCASNFSAEFSGMFDVVENTSCRYYSNFVGRTIGGVNYKTCAGVMVYDAWIGNNFVFCSSIIPYDGEAELLTDAGFCGITPP